MGANSILADKAVADEATAWTFFSGLRNFTVATAKAHRGIF
jgi:hypothetical protein